MSDFFGGSGGFNSGGSIKSNLDNYYAYTQTSGGGGGGSPSGGKGCGTTSSTIIIVVLVIVAIQNIVVALIVLGCIGLIGLIIYLILKRQEIAKKNNNESVNQETVSIFHTENCGTGHCEQNKSVTAETGSSTSDTQSLKKPVLEQKKNSFSRLLQEVKDYRNANSEWEDGIFFDFVYIAGSGFIQNFKAADESTSVGDKLSLEREPENTHDSNAIVIRNQAGIKLGYVPKKHNVQPAQLMDDGKELFGRLYSKRSIGKVLSMTIEIFIKNGCVLL